MYELVFNKPGKIKWAGCVKNDFVFALRAFCARGACSM